jgi:HSP20 family protein
MYLATYEPWNMLNQFRNEIDQVFGRINRTSHEDSAVVTSSWVPSVDIKEEAQHFLIEADIPGVEPKDIDISMENGVLTLKGERKAESQDEGKNYKRVERTYGSFYRRFSLPDTADAEKISASGKHGVLQITIPKKEATQPRKITVQA